MSITVVKASSAGRQWRADVLDAAFAVALTLLGLVGLHNAFGRYDFLAVGAAGALVGAALALLIVRRRLPALFGLALTVIVFLVVGSAVAISDHRALGVLPTPAGAAGLIDGSLQGWRRLLTTLPPSGSLGNLLAVPFLCGYVPALISTLLARTTKWLVAVLVMPAVVLAISVLFGGVEPYSLVVQGTGFAVVAIAWMAVRRSRQQRFFMQSSSIKRLVGGIMMLAVVGAAGFYGGPHLPFATSNSRYVLDRADPPFDPQQFGSPLNGYDKYLNGPYADKVLFTVSGVPAEPNQPYGLIRLATMDDYNGVVWEVSPTGGSQSYQFIRVGETVPTTQPGAKLSLSVKVGALPGVWVPDAGVVTGISWTTPGSRANTQRSAYRLSTYTQTGADPVAGGLASGDSYVIGGVDPPRPTEAELRRDTVDPSLRTKVDAEVPDTLSAKAGEVIKDKTNAYDQASAIMQWFRQNGYYTTGNEQVGESPLQPGHSAARLSAFMADDEPVGSSEQYAAAMALMARKVGLPARVVMGFRVYGTNAVAVKGSDVDAWVEIPFVDGGGNTTWVSFDPTPRDRTNKPPQTQSKLPRPKFESQDVPPPPQAPPAADVIALQPGQKQTPDAPKKGPEQRPSPPQHHVVLIGAAILFGVPLLVALVFVAIVLLAKRRRRRHRRRARRSISRIAGAWDEYVDTARDAGRPVPDLTTRQEAALVIGTTPSQPLAAGADAAIFGPIEPTEQDIDRYWADVATARRQLRRSLSPWARLRASLSLTSLRSRS